MATRGPIGERPGLPKPKPAPAPKAPPAPAPPAGVFFPGGLGHITIGAPLAPAPPRSPAPVVVAVPAPVAPPAHAAPPPTLGVLSSPASRVTTNLPPPKLSGPGATTVSGGLSSGLAGRLGGVHTITPLPGAPPLAAPGTVAWSQGAGPSPSIPIAAPVPPTLSLGGATSVLGAAAGGDPAAGAYVATTVASANSGHPLGVANAEVLTLAQRLSILSKFATQFVSPQAGQDILTGLHLAR